MSGRKVDYFVSEQTAPTEADCILVGLDARYVPYLLRLGLTQLSPAVWVSEADAERGYQGTLAWMEAILMDCGEAIVNNIIALRGLDPTAPRDPQTGVPLTAANGSTLVDIWNQLSYQDMGVGQWTSQVHGELVYQTQQQQEAFFDEDGALLQALLLLI